MQKLILWSALLITVAIASVFAIYQSTQVNELLLVVEQKTNSQIQREIEIEYLEGRNAELKAQVMELQKMCEQLRFDLEKRKAAIP